MSQSLSQTQSSFPEPQPLDDFIRRALAENRTVQAAYHNVMSLKERIPQVTALDDPVASNAVFPIPSVAPQYFLMGYNPYNLTLAQQFPWFGTLRLRGEAALGDVQVALAELAAAQLDTVAAVKRAYYNLYAGLKTDEILTENRQILEDFRTIARQRLRTGGTQQDVIRSEVLISELDREMANNQQGIAMARSALARQLHIRPDAELKTLPRPRSRPSRRRSSGSINSPWPPAPSSRAAWPRSPAMKKPIELARKRFYPNVTLGLTYMDMEKTNAQCAETASGSPERRAVRRLQPAGVPQQIPRRRLRGPGTRLGRHQAVRIPARRDLQRDPGPDGASEGSAKCP